MKIQVLSDLHLDHAPFYPDCEQADVVILAGDVADGEMGVIWALENLPKVPIMYVLGNHEYHGQCFSELPSYLKQLTQNTNVHILDNDSVTIGGVAFHGCTLWTDFALFDNPIMAMETCGSYIPDFCSIAYDANGDLFTPEDALAAHQQSRDWLLNQYPQNKAAHNVIVSHHAPHQNSVAPRFAQHLTSAAFVSKLDDVIHQLQPDVWVHGHTHDRFDYQVGDTRIVCNPRGYTNENDQFESQLLVELG